MRDEKMKSGNSGSRGSLDRSSFFRSEMKMSEVTYIAVSSRKYKRYTTKRRLCT